MQGRWGEEFVGSVQNMTNVFVKLAKKAKEWKVEVIVTEH